MKQMKNGITIKKKKWANIMMRKNTVLEDTNIDVKTANLSQMKNKKIKKEGDMFVWIPRFAYKIASEHHTGGTNIQGKITIQFLEDLTEKPFPEGISKFNNENGQNNWNIHPAFTYAEEVSGIWFSKFEGSNNNGNIEIRPKVAMNWNNLGIDEMYQKSSSYDTKSNSHMMKNVEWGAVAYLSQSIYGSCNVEKNDTQITGGTNYITNVNQSTTGNVYGVYDMNGGTNEYVAAYLDNGNTRFTAESKKNVDVYKKTYDLSIEKYGDSIFETSSKGIDSFAWNQGKSIFVDELNPYFLRGGNSAVGNNSGIFSFEKANGVKSNYTFRPTLIVH